MASKKLSIGSLQKKLWKECKRVVRAKYLNSDGSWTCYTCDKSIIKPKDAHTAHFIPKSVCGAFLKYDLRNLRICCYHCNINCGGNGAIYYKNMVSIEGQAYVDQLFLDKDKIVKPYDRYIEQLYEYQKII